MYLFVLQVRSCTPATGFYLMLPPPDRTNSNDRDKPYSYGETQQAAGECDILAWSICRIPVALRSICDVLSILSYLFGSD